MVKKIGIHLDAVIFVAVLLVGSMALNAYQYFQYSDLLAEWSEASWRAQDMEVDWHYVKGLLEQCRASCDVPR